jgi:DNA-binding winged helix-turn-helix (wHTH) protein
VDKLALDFVLQARIDLAREADFALGPLSVRPSRCQVEAGGAQRPVQRRVMQVLVALVGSGNEVVSQKELIQRCWGGLSVSDDAVSRCIGQLRRLANSWAEPPFEIETIPGVGYRLVVSEGRPDSQPGSAEMAVPPPLEAAASFREKAGRRSAGWIAAAAGLVLTAVAVWLLSPARDRPWVLLVERLKTPAGDAAAQALGVSLSADLARQVVGADQRLIVREPKDQPLFGGLWADYLITGEARTDGGVLHASVRLLDGRSRAILWSDGFSRPASEADAMRAQVAGRIADVAECAEGGRKPLPRSIDDQTLRLYLEGCEQKHGDWTLSAKLLGEAVRRRPDFAHAWAMYSAATAASASFVSDEAAGPILRRADAFARRALALDSTEGEAYDARASALPGIQRWPERTAMLMAGRRVDPDNPVLNIDIAGDMAAVGRWREAISFAGAAVQYDPFSTTMTGNLMRLVGFSGRPDTALQLADRTDRQWPRDPIIAEARFRVAAQVGDPAQALAMLANPKFELTPQEATVWRAVLNARLRRTPEAVDAAAKAVKAAAASPTDPSDVFDAVAQLVILGRVDDAYAVADRVPDRAWAPTWGLFYDFMAPFRADRRFMALAARQGLTQVWRATGVWPDFCQEQKLAYDCKAAAASAEAQFAPGLAPDRPKIGV